jgi:hypothetical protein
MQPRLADNADLKTRFFDNAAFLRTKEEFEKQAEKDSAFDPSDSMVSISQHKFNPTLISTPCLTDSIPDLNTRCP